jgi:hypothetical protein
MSTDASDEGLLSPKKSLFVVGFVTVNELNANVVAEGFHPKWNWNVFSPLGIQFSVANGWIL